MELKQHEVAALMELKALIATGQHIGKRRIVSMQGCEDAGLVERVMENGLIVDWKLTPAGEAWNG